MLAISWQTSANITSYNGYELNGDVVSNGNLEWLQWSTTDGLSMRQALNNYEQDGWSLASNSQVNALFGAFGFNATTQESSRVNTYSDYTFADDANHDHFIELFGSTLTGEDTRYGRGVNALHVTGAFYGSDDDGDGMFKAARVGSDYLDFDSEKDYNTLIYKDYIESGISHVNKGVALVRTLEVGEPSTFVIIALSLLGLATRRFKKQS